MSTELNHPVKDADIVDPAVEKAASPTVDEAPHVNRLAGNTVVLIRKLDWRIIGLVLVLGISIPVWNVLKSHARPQTGGTTGLPQMIVPAASVTREDLFNELPVYAEFRPYEEVELHAKVSGYVTEMKVDFGDRVKTGQLLATLEVPELQAQLTNAIAVLRRTEAEYKVAHLYNTRLAQAAKETPGSVAPQDLDAAEARDDTADAAVAAAKAEVDRFRTLVGYTRITAPFGGVITHRYVDPGTLIQAGTTSDTQSLPLVRVSDNYHLRLDFPVEVKYVKNVHVGDVVQVQVESLGNRTISGAITRATYKVNEATRTMTTEIEVPNPKLELVPGMYATVLLPLERRPQALAIPIQAIPPGQTSSVYVINDRNEIEERPVTLGLETPTKVEVLSGLKEGEKVLVGTRSQVQPGQKVEPKLNDSLALQ